MNRQIRNVITSLVVMVFAGIGLTAFGQDPTQTSPAQQPVMQPVGQPVVIQQTTEQNCTVQQTVQDFVVQQPQAAQPLACADLCELIKSIESNADDVRKYFRRSVRCLDCVDDSYYESVREFERATDRLKRNYRRSDCEACDVAGDVQEVLALANCISAYMDHCSLCPEATEAWTELQADLSQIAAQFCTTATFQQPVSLACPVPACAQPTCPAPAPVVVQPVQPAPVVVQPTCPAPVAQPACPAPGPVIFK
jgi:hypothetical protein